MEIAYFKRHQEDGIYNFYKVFGGNGQTKNGYQEVISFLNPAPIIYVEHNQPYDPSNPDKPFDLTGTWCTYEVGIPITRQEYEEAYGRATADQFSIT